MRDDDNDGIPDEPQHPALKKFNRLVFQTKEFFKETFSGAAKGAMIGAVALPAVAFVATAAIAGPFTVPAAGLMAWAGLNTNWGAATLIAGAMKGALIGGAIGGGIKGVSALTNGDELADDEEQRLVSKYQRSQQMAANQEMMSMNMQRMRAGAVQAPMMAGMQATPGQLPNVRGPGAGMGPGPG